MRKVIANLLIFTISKVFAENCCRQQLVKGFIFVKVFIRSNLIKDARATLASTHVCILITTKTL